MLQGLYSRATCLCLIFIAVLRCQTATHSSDAKAVNQQYTDSELAPVDCPTGAELTSFVFVALSALPTAASLGLPPPQNSVPPLVAPSEIQNVKLEICLKDEDLSLRRVISKRGIKRDVIEVVAGSEILGLAPALFSQDYSQLHVKIPFESFQEPGNETAKATTESLFLQGVGTADASFVYATYLNDDSGQTFLSPRAGNFILVGSLQYGDFAEDPCSGGHAKKGVFILGTAKFEWQGCQFAGTSGGTAPLIHEFVITDTSTKLPADLRGKPFKVKTDSSTTGNYIFRHNHHSICDSFALTLSQATYAVTSSIIGFGPGGCAGTVQDAPNPGASVSYRFKYGNSAWIKGKAPSSCTHYSRKCPQ